MLIISLVQFRCIIRSMSHSLMGEKSAGKSTSSGILPVIHNEGADSDPGEVERPVPDWENVHRELARQGVTLLLLWQEYQAKHPEGYGQNVIGSLDRDAADLVTQLYLPLQAPIVITDPRTAEMIKYASNAFLTTRISFINELADLCELAGADVKEVAAGMGYDAGDRAAG